MADSVNRIITPPVSLDRPVAIERERDRTKERGREEKKRDAAEKEENEPAALPDNIDDEEEQPADEKVGRSLNIKV